MSDTGDFAKTLIIAIVVSAVCVVIVAGLIYYIALNWSMLIRRATPNRWSTASESEKVIWPEPRKSSESGFSSPIASPTSSPRSSRMSSDPFMNKFRAHHEEPITPPRNVVKSNEFC
ncbi:hypothetical protein F4819DRAFT_77148 [Hypoxylon fuscum]|nr:hypothetical protein F4819DRAFT_77148 [Hypoxylon fuscum]